MHYDKYIPLPQAKVNIPALSESTIRRGTSESNVTMTTEIQVWYIHCSIITVVIFKQQEAVLDEASQTHPNAWWWVKADGCDLRALVRVPDLTGVVTST